MILVIFGTEQWSFGRLAEAADLLAERFPSEEVVAQIGNHTPPPSRAEVRPWLSFAEFGETIGRARIVITHAGSGSILTCLQLGKLPIVMPRREEFGEHVDDHQVELAERMSELGNCLLAESAAEVLDLVEGYGTAAATAEGVARSQVSLADTLGGYLASIES